MTQITIIINRQRYRLSCDEGEEGRITQLADFVSKQIHELKQSVGAIGNERLLVMTALTMADELWDAKKEIRELQHKIDSLKSPKVAMDFQEAADRLDNLKLKLERLGFKSPDEVGEGGFDFEYRREA